jgi:hypothetical protein
MRPPKKALVGENEVRRWWRFRVAAYESHFFASAVTDLSPKDADGVIQGRVFSVAFELGTRYYCFELQSDRDRFVRKYSKTFSARPVGKDPCP